MRPEQISDAIGILPNEIIEETDAVRNGNVIKQKHTRSLYKFSLVVACFVILIIVSIAWNFKQTDTEKFPNLPVISLSDEGNFAYGNEGYFAYDASELINANPWNDTMKLTSLPVYKNNIELDEFIPKAYDKDEVKKNISETVKELGMEEISFGKIEEQSEMGTLRCENDTVSISANAFGQINVEFKTPIELPKGYSFDNPTYDDYEKMAGFLKQEYSGLISMNNPITNVYGGDYNIYSRQSFSIGFYENSDDVVEKLINYNFRQINFRQSEDGKLCGIIISHPDLSGKVGDYPIISVKEARSLLEKGSYVTSSSYKMPGMEYVKKVELVYLTDAFEEYFIPYYKFYIEQPEEESEEQTEDENLDSSAISQMKSYSTYYVPAIASRYISNMPIYDGKDY